MSKRGQLTIFIFVGILVISVIIGLVFIFSSSSNSSSGSSQKSSAEVQEIRECIEDVIDHGVYYIYLQGGYAIPPEGSEPYLTLGIPVYWENNQSFVPSIQRVENEFKDFFEVNVPFCFEQDVDLENKVIVTLQDNILFFELEAPLSFISNGERTIVDDFAVEREVNFNEVYGIVNSVISANEDDLGYLPLSTLNQEVFAAGYTYEILEFDTETKMITVVMDSLDERGPLAYNFIVRYN